MSPTAAPLDDENLLFEILLRLPPLPSSLPRASAVCKRWLLVVSDPGFVLRFRRRHRRSPPLLGCFVPDRRGVSFTPTMDSPDRVPAGRFSLQLDDGCHYRILGCRHGLVLISPSLRKRVLVWDPVTGDQHHIAFPPWFDRITNSIHGAVLRAAGEVGHFQVILLQDIFYDHYFRVLACVYSSETGGWGNLITLPPTPSSGYCTGMPAVLVGNSFYWRIAGMFRSVLEFDLERQSLAVIQVPVDKEDDFTVMRAEGGGLGLLSVSGFTAQLWKRETDCDGVASWGLGRTIELDKLLFPNSTKSVHRFIIGFAEENNVVFLTTGDGVIMVDSLRSKELCKINNTLDHHHHHHHHAFESVYVAESASSPAAFYTIRRLLFPSNSTSRIMKPCSSATDPYLISIVHVVKDFVEMSLSQATSSASCLNNTQFFSQRVNTRCLELHSGFWEAGMGFFAEVSSILITSP